VPCTTDAEKKLQRAILDKCAIILPEMEQAAKILKARGSTIGSATTSNNFHEGSSVPGTYEVKC
jgi:hypothetical protein